MLRLTNLALAALATVSAGRPRTAPAPISLDPSQDVRELLAAARGAPPVLCALAAGAVGNQWGGWSDAPVTPLGRPDSRGSRPRGREATPADARFLLESLATGDPCVRELAIRLLAGLERQEVTPGLLERLSSADSTMRALAALGL